MAQIKINELPQQANTSNVSVLGVTDNGNGVLLPIEEAIATKEELATIGSKVGELVGGSTTTDHSNDTYTEAKAWKFADGTISAIDASQAKSCAVNAISLNKNQKITIKTATYSTNIKAYIVIGTDGTLIKSQSISATYSVEVFDYTAESACSVYINRLADKDFSCVVTTAGDGGKIATIESNISTLQSTASATSTNVGNLTELSTTEKSNLVKAINEVASKEVDAYSKSQSDNKYASKNISESLGDTDFDCQDCELTTIKKGGIKGALGTYDNNTTSSVMKCVTSYIDVDGYDKIVFRGVYSQSFINYGWVFVLFK